MDPPDISLGLGRFGGSEESSDESFIVASTTIQVGRIIVIVESVGRPGAGMVWVVHEKGRNELVNGLWALIPWSHLRRDKLRKCKNS